MLWLTDYLGYLEGFISYAEGAHSLKTCLTLICFGREITHSLESKKLTMDTNNLEKTLRNIM